MIKNGSTLSIHSQNENQIYRSILVLIYHCQMITQYLLYNQYYLYILTNKKNGVFYIGVINNLERRMFEHKNKLVK